MALSPEHDPQESRFTSHSATFAEKRAPEGTEPPEARSPLSEGPALASSWRALTRIATTVAVLTGPPFFLLLYRVAGLRLSASIVLAVVAVLALRGLIDVVARKFIPYPSLFNDEQRSLHSEDIVARRRAWFWTTRWRFALWFVVLAALLVAAIRFFMWIDDSGSWREAATLIPDAIREDPGSLGTIAIFVLYLPVLFLTNLLILYGPLMWAGIRQIHAFEPGESDWGVRLDDVRGQAQPKEAIRQIVTLWQSGEEFERAGGKRERGVLFLGPPGTGKTMMAKAIASGFRAPFISIAAPAFRGAFIGVDVIMVLYLGWRARRLARKWGGQCIIFIDEIDSVGLRRSGVAATAPYSPRVSHMSEICFHGPMGALTHSGDLVLETEAWRERLFAARQPTRSIGRMERISDRLRSFFFPGIGDSHGSSTLQQLLVLMDGVDAPRWSVKYFRTRLNTWLDALYVIPTRIGPLRLRMKPARPQREQLYFIGACNVRLDYLDPALTRPGRMGRQVRFRTPNTHDRKDIFDLYLGKIAREPELDVETRRDELARITMGHSPAMIEQVCSLGLTIAHHDRRVRCAWHDLVQAITIVEAGIEAGITFVPDEARATAIHEAGHAVTGHLVMAGWSSTRLSIRPRSFSLGHHNMAEIDERYGRWRHEKLADLVWTLGAMAAEVVFYGETTTGVSGDVDTATAEAAMMAGEWGMPPRVPTLDDQSKTEAAKDAEQRRLMRRFEQLGLKLMNRTSSSGSIVADPVTAVLSDPTKRTLVAQTLGQAFLIAHAIILANRDATERVAERLIEKQEMFGQDVVALLDSQGLRLPTIDPSDEAIWPRI